MFKYHQLIVIIFYYIILFIQDDSVRSMEILVVDQSHPKTWCNECWKQKGSWKPAPSLIHSACTHTSKIKCSMFIYVVHHHAQTYKRSYTHSLWFTFVFYFSQFKCGSVSMMHPDQPYISGKEHEFLSTKIHKSQTSQFLCENVKPSSISLQVPRKISHVSFTVPRIKQQKASHDDPERPNSYIQPNISVADDMDTFCIV